MDQTITRVYLDYFWVIMVKPCVETLGIVERLSLLAVKWGKAFMFLSNLIN